MAINNCYLIGTILVCCSDFGTFNPQEETLKGRVTKISLAFLFVLFPEMLGQCRHSITVILKGGS